MNGTIDSRSAFREFKAEFSSMVDKLAGEGVKVFVVLDVPNMNVNVPDNFLKMSILNEEPTYQRPRAEIDERIRELRDFFESQDVVLLDFTDHFCSGDHCPAFENGVPLYRDDDHLSVFGAMTTLTGLRGSVSGRSSADHRRPGPTPLLRPARRRRRHARSGRGGGGARIRTGDQGFAVPCLTTWLRRRTEGSPRRASLGQDRG